MRVTRQAKAAARQAILDSASRLFRVRGFSGVGIADVMREAGLTHGAFYGHFRSKEDLQAQACRHAVDRMLEAWAQEIEGKDDPMGALTTYYLSEAHRDSPEMGCLMAALGPELARQPPAVRQVVSTCLERVLAFLTEIAPEGTAAERHEATLRRFSTMVGAMVVSRATDSPAVSAAFLETARGAVGKRET